MSTEVSALEPANLIQPDKAVEVKKVQTTSSVKSFLAGGFGGVSCVLVGKSFEERNNFR
jgi:hypothetical protein